MDNVKIVFKALRISFKTKLKASILVDLIGICFALVPILNAYILSVVTDKVQSVSQGNLNQMKTMLLFVVLLIALYIGSTVFRYIQNYIKSKDNMKIQEYIKQNVINCACSVEYRYIDNYDNFRNKLIFTDQQSGRRVANSVQVIFSWINNIIAFISVTIALSIVNGWIVLFLLLTSVPAAYLAYKQKDELYRKNIKWMKEGAMVIHYYGMCISDQSLSEVRHLHIVNFLKARWKEIAGKYIYKKNKLTKKHVIYNSVADILRNAVFAIVLFVAAVEIYKNPIIGIGIFMLVLNLASTFQTATTNLLVGFLQIADDVHYMKEFFSLEEMVERKEEEPSADFTKADIAYERVSFTYPNTNEPVLKNINVQIKDGETVAIVGENGSGKTTFINLLCGFYQPDNGKITIDGKDIFDNINQTRRSISAVFQNFGQYDTSIRKNITISDQDRIYSDEELNQFVKQVGLEELIAELPSGLDEELGMLSSNTHDLSGGQWQKIALARTLFRTKAKIMILDEPTASLDPIAEARLYENFARMTSGKTTLLISHRLGITAHVDRILVFKDGEIIEDGNHRELMKLNKEYARLYRAQSQWYTENLENNEMLNVVYDQVICEPTDESVNHVATYIRKQDKDIDGILNHQTKKGHEA